MNNLDEERKLINSIDDEMLMLFIKRMEVAKRIGQYKFENNLPILDKKREEEIIASRVKDIEDEEMKEYIIQFLKELMNISKRVQENVIVGKKVAYCGVEGAFAQIASKRVFDKAELIGYPDFSSAYQAVENGECDRACLPIENSNVGDVGSVMDLVFQGSLYINKIYELEIDQCLLGVKGTTIDSIKTIISHPQALSQCKAFIDSHSYNTMEYGNTALAAKEVVKLNDPSIAVIASAETATLYGLDIIKEKVNTSRDNTTRFAMFSNKITLPNKESKVGENFIIVFTCKNEAGSLAKTLNIIGAHCFNMRNLRSRPLKGLMWNYYFFVELEGNVNSQDGQDMMQELKPFCDLLRLVGTYNSNK